MENNKDDLNENIRISEIIVNKNEMDITIEHGVHGPQNPIKATSPTFINIYSSREQRIRQNEFIIFDNINSIFGQCIHISNTSEIYVWKPGYYSVFISIHHLESCQFSLLKNSEFIAPASTVGSLSGNSQNSNLFIIQLTDQDMIINSPFSDTGYSCKLQVINNTPPSYMQYVTLIGSFNVGNTIPQITASITIQSIT